MSIEAQPERETASAEKMLASIGIPVFQGENYLGEAIEAARSQTHPYLEIVVSDNASTDRTAEIIRQQHTKDQRVRSVAQESNIGAAENYNEVFRESHGEFFAWNAHDDYTSPDFISAGIAALEADPEAVIAIAHPFHVDSAGAKLRPINVPPELTTAQSPAARFRAAARCNPAVLVFGLYRREALLSTSLHEQFTGSDRNLVAEAMLVGRAVWAGSSEFYLRHHDNRSVRRLRSPGSRFSFPREAWYAPTRAGKMVFPSWRRLGGYAKSIFRAPISPLEKVACVGALARLLVDDRFKLTKYLLNDLLTAGAFVVRSVRRG